MSSMQGSMGYAGPNGKMGNKIPAGYKQGQLQQFTPQQLDLFQQAFSQVDPGSFTSRLAGGDQSMFEQMEAPAMRQFNELQGQNASRFSGMGMGARKGSGFQNSMNAVTSNFAQDLQSRRMEMRQQAIKDLMGMSSELLGQRPYDQFLVKKQQRPSLMQGLISGGLAGAGAGIGAYYGGPQGAKTGYDIGSSAGQSLMGDY